MDFKEAGFTLSPPPPWKLSTKQLFCNVNRKLNLSHEKRSILHRNSIHFFCIKSLVCETWLLWNHAYSLWLQHRFLFEWYYAVIHSWTSEGFLLIKLSQVWIIHSICWFFFLFHSLVMNTKMKYAIKNQLK